MRKTIISLCIFLLLSVLVFAIDFLGIALGDEVLGSLSLIGVGALLATVVFLRIEGHEAASSRLGHDFEEYKTYMSATLTCAFIAGFVAAWYFHKGAYDEMKWFNQYYLIFPGLAYCMFWVFIIVKAFQRPPKIGAE